MMQTRRVAVQHFSTTGVKCSRVTRGIAARASLFPAGFDLAGAAATAAAEPFVKPSDDDNTAVPIVPVRSEGVEASIERALGATAASWAVASRFEAKQGKVLLVPGPSGRLAGVVFGLGSPDETGSEASLFRSLPGSVPRGVRYRLVENDKEYETRSALLGWGLGSYSFQAYKSANGRSSLNNEPIAKLLLPEAHSADVARTCSAIYLTRDLINMPPNDMNPEQLEAAARSVAARHGAKSFRCVAGDALLNTERCPLIHAVGRASMTPPRLIDFSWESGVPPKSASGKRYRVVLVGKGVTFDTGGLNLKPGSNMLAMKKDMGGAANVLGLASMLMSCDLPNLELRVLIPAVENSLSGGAFRPSDIIPSRKGLRVEIGNTDAEGRLVLADALTIAAEGAPDLVVDMATLTGAHRVALGKDVPGYFTDSDELAAKLDMHSRATRDALWRLPLWKPYRKFLDSKVADINNVGSQPLAGAITAALFLKEFTESSHDWIHVDLNAMDDEGWGEAQGIRALCELIRERADG